MLYPSVGPLEEDLGDQVVRRRIAVLSHEPVGHLLLSPTVDVEGSERDTETLRQLPGLSVRRAERNAGTIERGPPSVVAAGARDLVRGHPSV